MRQRTLWPGDPSAHLVLPALVIHWVCRAPAHLSAASRGGRGGLTVHSGRWAYCDGMVEDDEHRWEPTGGVAIDRLIDWGRVLASQRGFSVRR